MNVEIRQEGSSDLTEYASIPIAFEVRERLAVIDLEAGLAGLHLAAERIATPYVKDYDAEPFNHPTAWRDRFDLSLWGILGAYVAGRRVGGAAVAWGEGASELTDARPDLSVLWDLRIAPEWRGRGIASALFRAAEAWSFARGAHWLRAETQTINVPACCFYARQGCVLGAIHRFAYPTLPDETQLLWYRRLSAPPPADG